jgi:hypothetical protein
MGHERFEVVGGGFALADESVTSVRLGTAAAVVAALLFVPARADAYRPFDGTDADVAEHNVFELELGPVQYLRQGSQNFLVAPALVLNYGIFERMELVIDANEDIALGKLDPGTSRVSLVGDDVLVKYLFREGTLQEKKGVSIAAEGGVLTPEVHGSTGFGGSLDVIAAYQWSWGTIHWNEWVEYTREHHADLFSGVIVEGPHDWVVRPVSEVFYDKDFRGDQTESVLVGAIWSARESLAFDVGLRGARMGGDYVGEVRLGLTWSIGIGEHAPHPAPREAGPGFWRRL